MSRLFAPPGEIDLRPSLNLTYDLWLASWEAALSAVAAATRIRALSTKEAAEYRAVIDAERELVTEDFALPLGHELPFRRVRDDVSMPRAEERLYAK
jgi:hypothetical protein